MTFRAVIFDIGGVLQRTEDPTSRIKWEQRFQMERRGLEALVFGCEESARATVGQATDADVWKSVGRELRLDESELEELQVDFWAGDRLDTELVAFLRSLRPRYEVGILSNA